MNGASHNRVRLHTPLGPHLFTTAAGARGGRISVTVLVLAWLVGACASYEARPLEPRLISRDYLERRLADPELVRFAREELHLEFPPVRWTVDSLWAVALFCDPTIARTRAEERVGGAAQRTARQMDNPELSLQPELISNPAAGASPWVLGMQAWLPFQTGSRREKQQELASAELAEARIAPLAAAWQARVRVRETLIATLAADRARDLASRALTLLDQELAAVQARFDAGAISRLELRTVEVDHERASRVRVTLEHASVEHRARLAAAIGVGADALTSIDLDPDELERLGSPPADAREILETGLMHRSDLRRGLAAYEVAERVLALQVERARPDLRLGPGFQFDQGTTRWQLGLSFELPIFHQHQGEIAEAEARREVSKASFEELQARAIGEIQAALAAFEGRHAELAAAETVLDGATRRTIDATSLVAAGEIDRLEVIYAMRREVEAEQFRIEVLGRAQMAQTALETAIEHPLDPEPGEMRP